MDLPSAADIREWSNVGFPEYGYPVPVDPEPDRLQRKVDEAKAELDALVGRAGVVLTYDTIGDTDGQKILVEKAIQMLTEYDVLSSQQAIVATASDFDLIQSQSIGPISESRRNISANGSILHPWPQLNKLLQGIISVANGGMPEQDFPVFQSVENRTDVQRPGFDLMYAQYWVQSIFGELRPLGVYRPGWDGP